MLKQYSELGDSQYDLCIIGAGPAGIVLALEYAKLHPAGQVLLVEYGPPQDPAGRNQLDDTIQITNPANHHPPYECTNKGIGGTSATWGGRCVMYDEVDFADRPIVAGGCTWDSSLMKEVQTFVPTASEYFECGTGAFNTHDISAFTSARIAEGFREGDVTDSVVERWSMPTRFGPRYQPTLEQAGNITVIQGAEARSFRLSGQQVTACEIRDVASGQPFTIRAKVFTLAAGCQETTRLLLRNKDLFTAIGGPPASLGKYYQGHISGKIASIRFHGDPRKTDYGFMRDDEGIYFRRRLQLSTEALCRHNLLNTALWLDNPLYFDPSHKSGAMSFMYLAMLIPVIGKRLAPPAIAHSITKGKVNKIGRHFWNIIRGLPGSLLTPAIIFFKRYCLKRKLPGVFLYSPENKYALHFHAEQVPDPANRMELGPDGETLVLHYDLVEDDITSVIRTHEVLDETLRSQGCGELQYWFTSEELPAAIREMSRDGIHQSGTTRIADSPEGGVVDRDLKVWGTSNLYVCSTSVFPTSGQANPTFLIGAFAVRLANSLARL